MSSLIAAESVAQRILLLRGLRVMLDADLAEMYGVPTKRFNEQIKRNLGRFPADFMFQLTEDEYESLRSQFATSNTGRGGRRYLPYAFTEHGAIMAAAILNSPKAVEMSVFIVRAFVQLREMLSSNKELEMKLLELERKVSSHDQAIAGVTGMTNMPPLIMKPAMPVSLSPSLSRKRARGAKTRYANFSLIDAIRQLMKQPVNAGRPIGFTASIAGSKK